MSCFPPENSTADGRGRDERRQPAQMRAETATHAKPAEATARRAGTAMRLISAWPSETAMAILTSVFAHNAITIPLAATGIGSIAEAISERDTVMASTSASPAAALDA